MNEYKVRAELDRVEDRVLDLSICNINDKAKDAELKQKREVFIKTTKRAQHTNPTLNHLN
ncbi:MAG: hypothetical protein N4A43_00905 [Alphaproteobacteria bacterium]|jgi:phage gp16-like protein|nr:hypothetical protein [Alphaproteobacteria bacterium]